MLGELTALFIRCRSTQENIHLAEEAVTLSKQMLTTVEARAAKGAAPEAEVMRAKAALTRASIRLQALRSSFERQKVALSSFWGNTNPQFAELSGSLSAFGTSDDFASLLQRAKQSPAIAIFASEARMKDAERLPLNSGIEIPATNAVSSVSSKRRTPNCQPISTRLCA